MRIEQIHDWDVTVARALEIQRSLAITVIPHGDLISPHLIAGVDVSVDRSGAANAVAVVLNYPDLEVLEISASSGKATFPYIPGLLSFREIPLTLRACEKLRLSPDLVIVDGQGFAHPRRIGLASHLGLLLNTPTIGCAKSPLFGQFQLPGNVQGDCSPISDEDAETIGAVVRTKSGVKPLYISIGHKIDLTSAVQWVLKCCRGYRLPEPTRQAHLASKGNVLQYPQNDS
jgi:deoxyribonuclease V